MPAFQKIEIDDQVAVLYSPDYGMGWSTRIDSEYSAMLCMDARIVGPFLKNGMNAALVAATSLIPNFNIKPTSLDVKWVQKNTMFNVIEIDGAEVVKLYGQLTCMVA